MKRLIVALAVALVAVYSVHAELAPGTVIGDYLPEIGEGTLELGDAMFTFGSIDEFEIEDTKYKLKGDFTTQTANGTITLEELEFDPDPLVTAKMLVFNDTLQTQTYTFYIAQPAYLATLSSSVRGSVVVSLMDDAADGSSTFSNNGTPVYKAYIDGNLVDTLMDPPFSFTTSEWVGSAQDEFGEDTYGAGVTTSIGIEIEFNLSAGDSATVLSRFEVVPEPATMGLMGVFAGGIIFVRRFFPKI